jgi:hypothetical protein
VVLGGRTRLDVTVTQVSEPLIGLDDVTTCRVLAPRQARQLADLLTRAADRVDPATPETAVPVGWLPDAVVEMARRYAVSVLLHAQAVDTEEEKFADRACQRQLAAVRRLAEAAGALSHEDRIDLAMGRAQRMLADFHARREPVTAGHGHLVDDGGSS